MFETGLFTKLCEKSGGTRTQASVSNAPRLQIGEQCTIPRHLAGLTAAAEIHQKNAPWERRILVIPCGFCKAPKAEVFIAEPNSEIQYAN